MKQTKVRTLKVVIFLPKLISTTITTPSNINTSITDHDATWDKDDTEDLDHIIATCQIVRKRGAPINQNDC